MEKPKKILISLVNWVKYLDTINCIDSVLKSEYFKYKIRVIDNKSNNFSKKKIKEKFPNIELEVAKNNDGYAAGHLINVNFAIKNNFDGIWILNSDVEVQPNTLKSLINAWDIKGSNIYGSVSLKNKELEIIDFGGGLKPDETTLFSYNIYYDCKYNSLPNAEIREVQSVEGSSMLIPLELIVEHGFMKTNFFMYGEETDYCFRMRRKGIKSYIVKNSIIFHNNASSFIQKKNITWIQAYYKRRNYMRFLMEHYNWGKRKVLNHNDNFFSRLKFKVKFFLFKNFRINNLNSYWKLIGSEHAAKGTKGKTIDPLNYL